MANLLVTKLDDRPLWKRREQNSPAVCFHRNVRLELVRLTEEGRERKGGWRECGVEKTEFKQEARRQKEGVGGWGGGYQRDESFLEVAFCSLWTYSIQIGKRKEGFFSLCLAGFHVGSAFVNTYSRSHGGPCTAWAIVRHILGLNDVALLNKACIIITPGQQWAYKRP